MPKVGPPREHSLAGRTAPGRRAFRESTPRGVSDPLHGAGATIAIADPGRSRPFLRFDRWRASRQRHKAPLAIQAFAGANHRAVRGLRELVATTAMPGALNSRGSALGWRGQPARSGVVPPFGSLLGTCNDVRQAIRHQARLRPTGATLNASTDVNSLLRTGSLGHADQVGEVEILTWEDDELYVRFASLELVRKQGRACVPQQAVAAVQPKAVQHSKRGARNRWAASRRRTSSPVDLPTAPALS